MSVETLPLLSHNQMCQSPIYGDTRWDARPQHNRRGNAGDIDWVKRPLQAPYFETDVGLMSYNLNLWRDSKGNFRPEVLPDPCVPTATKYCSFGKSVWEYDKNYPSMTIPTQPCRYRGKTTVQDICALDQQELNNVDREKYMKSLL